MSEQKKLIFSKLFKKQGPPPGSAGSYGPASFNDQLMN
jgi:hypothetical protein